MLLSPPAAPDPYLFWCCSTGKFDYFYFFFSQTECEIRGRNRHFDFGRHFISFGCVGDEVAAEKGVFESMHAGEGLRCVFL